MVYYCDHRAFDKFAQPNLGQVLVLICVDACFPMIFVLHQLPNLHVKDMVQRVHVDPQIREQEFGNFQDPGLTQKAQQGAKTPCFGSWVGDFVGAMCCISIHGRSWKSCCFYRVGEVLPGKKKVAYFI